VATQVHDRHERHVVVQRASAHDIDRAMDHLFEVFPDHWPDLCGEDESSWIFRLRWATDPHGFIDPKAPAAAKALFGIELSELGDFHVEGRLGKANYVFSMLHSWAAIAPARAAMRTGRLPTQIVHVDDHTDMMPFLGRVNGERYAIQDALLNSSRSFLRVNDVCEAIATGLFHKGSFLSAYWAACPEASIVHMREGHREQAFRLALAAKDFVVGGKAVVGTELHRQITSDLGELTQVDRLPRRGGRAGEPIWLDIDLDAFCNRFDGDSDRRAHAATVSETEQTFCRVDRFLEQLQKAEWLGDIEAVSVAVSPGFFPADYWELTVPRIVTSIGHMLAYV